MCRHPNTPHYYNTYPVNMIDLVMIVPNAFRSAGSAYTNNVASTYIIDMLLLANAVARKLIAMLLNPRHARSVLYYFFDSYRMMHGVSSVLPLRNAPEYWFRLLLPLFSIFYSTTLSLLFMQYVYDINRQEFGSVEDVVRADLPVYCQEYLANNVPTPGPFESDCLLRLGDKALRDIDGVTAVRYFLVEPGSAPRVAMLTSAERMRWIEQLLWHDRRPADRPFRMLQRVVGQQYRTFALSLFDPLGQRYEGMLRRAGEHGFLQYFAERNRQVGGLLALEFIGLKLFIAVRSYRRSSS